MGTVGYMSPEQVRGDPADVPSDIFSYGCVLHEMLAGQRAFARETPAQTMAAILEAEPPDLAGSEKQIPAELKRTVTRCLDKHPRQRFQSEHDLAFALRAVPGLDSAAALPGRPQRLRLLLDSVRPGGGAGRSVPVLAEPAGLPTLRITARSLAFRYQGPQVDPQKAGRELHVRAVLTGRVTERNGALNIQAELMNVDNGAQL